MESPPSAALHRAASQCGAVGLCWSACGAEAPAPSSACTHHPATRSGRQGDLAETKQGNLTAD